MITLLWCCGCARDVNANYGGLTDDSLNGVRVFAQLLKADGHRVRATLALSPKLMENSDVLVYFLRSDAGIPEQTRYWFEDWLSVEPGRSLIVIPRDYDAEPQYWEFVNDNLGVEVTDEEQARVDKRLKQARSVMSAMRNNAVDVDENEWFGLSTTPAARVAKSVNGDDAWTTDLGLKQGNLELVFNRRLELPEDAQPLVTSGMDVMLARMDYYDGNIWIAANGSFLLNYPLINHEHRKLALGLSRELGRKRRIVFVLGTRQFDSDAAQVPTLWKALTLTPVNWIAGHLLVFLLLFGLSRFAIFGRPREPQSREVYQFEKHVDALGSLLEKTGDADFARVHLDVLRSRLSPESESVPQEKQ